ncbi:MAG: hypothetical protein WAM85_01730 [Terracidiphilus sp.]
MASQALHHVQPESLTSTVRFTAAYTGLLSATTLTESPAFTQLATPEISRAEALRGAKGAMMAIGLESAGVLCFLGVWLAWHYFA